MTAIVVSFLLGDSGFEPRLCLGLLLLFFVVLFLVDMNTLVSHIHAPGGLALTSIPSSPPFKSANYITKMYKKARSIPSIKSKLFQGPFELSERASGLRSRRKGASPLGTEWSEIMIWPNPKPSLEEKSEFVS